MKPIFAKKSPLERKNFIEENMPLKEFPIIQEVDPDEKKKKKEREEENIHAANIFSRELTNAGKTALVKRITPTLADFAALSGPIIEKIKMQKVLGITKTEFLINTKTFGEVEIHLTMYDSDPFSFHLKILGNTKLQELSMKHQSMLTSKIKQSLPHIKLHIAPPVLRKKDRFVTKGKKSIEKTKTSWYGAVKGEGQKE